MGRGEHGTVTPSLHPVHGVGCGSLCEGEPCPNLLGANRSKRAADLCGRPGCPLHSGGAFRIGSVLPRNYQGPPWRFHHLREPLLPRHSYRHLRREAGSLQRASQRHKGSPGQPGGVPSLLHRRGTDPGSRGLPGRCRGFPASDSLQRERVLELGCPLVFRGAGVGTEGDDGAARIDDGRRHLPDCLPHPSIHERPTGGGRERRRPAQSDRSLSGGRFAAPASQGAGRRY
jgi:hypothetical protein